MSESINHKLHGEVLLSFENAPIAIVYEDDEVMKIKEKIIRFRKRCENKKTREEVTKCEKTIEYSEKSSMNDEIS